jgi:hypothetical protein
VTAFELSVRLGLVLRSKLGRSYRRGLMPPRSGLLDHPYLSNHGAYEEALMTNTPATTWIRVGLFGLQSSGC